jgi:hypothetical protein
MGIPIRNRPRRNAVRGYEVVASDRRAMGRVAEVKDGYMIVESGRLRKRRRPVPREFVHVVDGASKAFVTVPRRVLQDAPEADRQGNFDLQKAALHYGLAEGYEQIGRAPAEHRRAELRKHMRPAPANDHSHRSPALLGDRHWDRT